MENQTSLRRAARIAFYTSIILLTVKFVAFYLTGSKAVFSDAIESIINVVTGAFLLLSIRVSLLPVDKNHPYGHGKIEEFSAGLEGGLIILAAIMIMVEAVPGFFIPVPPRNLGPGIILVMGAGGVNFLVGLYLLHSGKKLKSAAIRADGLHLMTDFYTSIGVVGGLVLVQFTGQTWLDPLVACLVAMNILVPGLGLLRSSIRNLMNEADPELLGRIVLALNDIKQPGWLYPHKLRALRSGRYHHVDLHISLPHYWSLERVHAAEQGINETLLATLGEDGDVMIHVDPCEASYCKACELAACHERTHDYERPADWGLEEVVSPRPDRAANDQEEK